MKPICVHFPTIERLTNCVVSAGCLKRLSLLGSLCEDAGDGTEGALPERLARPGAELLPVSMKRGVDVLGGAGEGGETAEVAGGDRWGQNGKKGFQFQGCGRFSPALTVFHERERVEKSGKRKMMQASIRGNCPRQPSVSGKRPKAI